MITIYTSADQNKLLEYLASDLIENQKSLFQPLSLITSGFLQEMWIKEEVAKLNGILANVRTYRPDRFITWLDFVLSGNTGEEKYSLHQLEWIYFSLMGSHEFRSKFPELDSYYMQDQVKRFALAQKAVSLLDKYQDFRAELIQEWKRNSNLNTADWQEFLFVKALEMHGALISDKSTWPHQIQSKLASKEAKQQLKKQVPVLYLFGSFSISPKFLEVMNILKEEIIIHWYRVDFDFDHPIARNWSEGTIRNKMAFQEIFSSDLIQNLDVQAEFPLGNTLLSKIHYVLATNKPISILKEDLRTDSSLEFHSCHTKVREVESLYNYLLRLLEKHREIGARDIQVFVPDLDSYIAPIRTVFDTAPISLPYRIISGGYSHEESFWSALVQLLSIDSEQFTASQIMELVEAKAIRERFGFEDLELIRKLMSDANLARDYEGSETTESRYYSFEYGLKRLIYGYLLGKDHFLYDDGQEEIFTVDGAEGKQADDLFRLFDFVRSLNGVLIQKEISMNLKSWLAWLSSVADKFFTVDPAIEQKFQYLLQELGLIEDFVEETIDYKTFSFRLIHLLEEMDSHPVAGFGGIIFSQLIPGSVLPKKVIAMMGMNFREFPRTAKELSFDKLLEGDRSPLDPNPRISDQATFIEALFAARKALYFSFLGKSDQDNSTIPASTVVEELIDLVTSSGDSKSKDVIVSHPLHSFSVRYNQDNNAKLKNYLIQEEGGIDFSSTSEREAFEIKEVNLIQLKSFFKDPFKYYYNHVLGIYYSDQRHQLINHEPFDSDNFNDWLIKSSLLHNQKEDFDLIRKELVAEGLLPLRNVGKAILDGLIQDTEELKSAYTQLLPVEKRQVSVLLEGISLTGQLNFAGDTHLLFVTPSKTEGKTKYLIEAALDYLLGVAEGGELGLHFLSMDQKSFWENKITQEEAKEKLSELIKIFISHNDKRFVYSPDLQKVLSGLDLTQIQSVRAKIVGECNSRYSYLSEYLKKDESDGFFEEDSVIQEILANDQIISEIFKPF